MRKEFLFICVFIFISACDDGDIIVSDFNFDTDSTLNLCEFEGNRKLLHIVTDSNEAISFTFEENFSEIVNNVIEPNSITVEINASNRINYRRLANAVESDDYFCQEIPPSQPDVLEEFESTTGGTAIFSFVRASGDGIDTDNDQIPDLEEREQNENGDFIGDPLDYDTDGDGIPNFLDTDDDNDNVPTITEVGGSRAPDIDLDTDEDGVPNYLDNDDDGDGVITRYEDLNALDEGTPPAQIDLNPIDDDTDGDGIPNYLDSSFRDSLMVEFFRDNIVSRTFVITVVLQNISLQNVDSESTIRFNNQGLGNFRFATDDEIIEFRE